MKIQREKFNAFITAVIFMLLSCSQPPIVVPSQGGQYPYPGQPGQPGGLPPGYNPPGTNIDPPPRGDPDDGGVTRPPSRRDRPPVTRRPTRRVSGGICNDEFGGDRCDEDDDCWGICWDIFHSRTDRKLCGERKSDLVDAFDELLGDMETGSVENIDGVVLQCLFKIDDADFMGHLNRLTTKQAKAFLTEIGYEEDLAEAIFELDEENDILENLLEEANFKDRWDFLTEEVDSRDTLLEVILERDNEDAWLWLDNYVRLRCASDTTNYCGGTILDNIYDRANDTNLGLGEEEQRDAFTAYCKALKDSNNDYETIQESELFERDYEDFIVDLEVCCEEEDAEKFDGTDCLTRYGPGDANTRGERKSSCNKHCTDSSDCPGSDTCEPICPSNRIDGNCSNLVKRCNTTEVGYKGRLKYNEGGLREACRIACIGSDSDGRCGQ